MHHSLKIPPKLGARATNVNLFPPFFRRGGLQITSVPLRFWVVSSFVVTRPGTLYQWYKLVVAYSAQSLYATTGYESVIINSTQFYFTTILQVNETYHGWSSAT